MCDYSTYSYPRTLGVGDELVALRIASCCIGFVLARQRGDGFTCNADRIIRACLAARSWLLPGDLFRSAAVELPPNSRLRLTSLKQPLRWLIGLSDSKDAPVTGGTIDEFPHRGGLRSHTGEDVFFQTLPEGQRARVISVGSPLDWQCADSEL
jgi:hypothetical protein